MSRRHADPVQVVRLDGIPAQFLWRDRLYLVRTVLAEWVESTAWWRTPAAVALHTGAPGGGHYTGDAAVAVEEYPEPVRLDELDQQLWRVAAAAGQAAPIGVFDLTYREADDRWFLTRVHD